MLVALSLPLLLAVTVAAVGIVGRVQGVERAGLGDTGTRPDGGAHPRRVRSPSSRSTRRTRAAPDARRYWRRSRRSCRRRAPCCLRGRWPTRLRPGTRAWAAAPRPAVLRCGLTRPAELTPTSALLEVNGVRWLQLDDGVPDPVIVSYVAVDRPVYVVLTTPTSAGSGPLQAVADVLRQTMDATDVVVR